MVRFIIQAIALFEVYLCYIYIPIWLDLLFRNETRQKSILDNLHSNMVRFIIFTISSNIR